MTTSLSTLLVIVATIVAGEVGTTVPAARLPVACTVLEDHRRGQDLTTRWYGRATPTTQDIAAARLALAGGCDHLPYFRFLGSARDLEIWLHLGYVDPATDEIWTWTRGRWTAVGVVDTNTTPAEKETQQRISSNVQLSTCNLQRATCTVQRATRSIPR